ncbi:hypothetical protein C1H46_027821 [Malus baccata]|uniref:Uncharacterized protein n=1 Tax=Malus baccata TaxID=106549 RepID=A0A540LJH5_MALBA|nr:hypothetical protein C1H46_027821 [Malus baccata]
MMAWTLTNQTMATLLRSGWSVKQALEDFHSGKEGFGVGSHQAISQDLVPLYGYQ